MTRCAATLAALLPLAGCGASVGSLPPDPAMDAEVRRQVAAGIAVQARAIELGGFEALRLTDKHAAPVRFDGKTVLCARVDDAARARVLMVDLVEFADSELQGPWFDYLWRRSGC